jgi:hypothetical protein
LPRRNVDKPGRCLAAATAEYAPTVARRRGFGYVPGMRDLPAWLNALAIFGATTVVIVWFDLSPLWYSAALLAWIVRRQRVYRAQEVEAEKAPAAAAVAEDQTAENL